MDKKRRPLHRTLARSLEFRGSTKHQTANLSPHTLARHKTRLHSTSLHASHPILIPLTALIFATESKHTGPFLPSTGPSLPHFDQSGRKRAAIPTDPPTHPPSAHHTTTKTPCKFRTANTTPRRHKPFSHKGNPPNQHHSETRVRLHAFLKENT